MKSNPLQIPKNQSWKGITIYCYHCSRNVSSICKEAGEKPLKECPFGDKHIFKVYTYVPGTAIRKTKNLGRDWKLAVQGAIAFEKEVKNNIQHVEVEPVNKPISKNEEQKIITETVAEDMAWYIGYLYNDPEIVPSFRRKERTKAHILDVERCFRRALKCWGKAGYDIKTLTWENMDEMIIEKFHNHLLHNLKLSNRSYNKNLSMLTSFYDCISQRRKYTIPNPFTSIQRRPTNTNVDTITKEEYERLLEIIQKKELGKHTLKTGEVKIYFKEWMYGAVELGLETGRRNEEIARMKFSDIFENEGKMEYVRILDLKVNRQRGREGSNAKEIIIPVTENLKEVLLRLGYEKYKGSDTYIIGPDEKMTRESITRFFSQSFSHYYNLLGTGKKLTYKNLRKTHISQLSAFMGIDNARLITKHSGSAVMEQHYIDKKVIAMTAKNFKMFEENDKTANERRQELKEARTKTKETNKIIER